MRDLFKTEVQSIEFWQDSAHNERGENKTEPWVFLLVAAFAITFIVAYHFHLHLQ